MYIYIYISLSQSHRTFFILHLCYFFIFFLTVIYVLFYTIVCHGGYSHPTGYVGFSICLHFIYPVVE